MHLCPSCDYENPTQLLPEFLKQLLLQPQRSSGVSSSASPCPQEGLGQSDVDTGTWAVGLRYSSAWWRLGFRQKSMGTFSFPESAQPAVTQFWACSWWWRWDKSFLSPASLASLERTRLEGCRVSGAIWKHRTLSVHYTSVLLSSASLTPVWGI